MSFIMFVAFFIRPFYKTMLGKKVTFEDMQDVVRAGDCLTSSHVIIL